MKLSIDHLPQDKQIELQRIVEVIRELSSDVEMVILYGSYARGDWKTEEDLSPKRLSGHASDYDIFVVVRERETARDVELWARVTKHLNAENMSTHPRVVPHDIEYLNIRLAEDHYFFRDMKHEGCMLFDTGNFQLAQKRDLLPAEEMRIAEEHYENWYESAQGFYRFFEFGVKDGNLKLAAYQLHQATESAYKTCLLVFTGYSPHEHYLSLLEEMVVEQEASIGNIFPRQERLDAERFQLLDYSYIGGRYDPDFRITRSDLEILAQSVKALIERTKTICMAKIKSFEEK